VTAKSLFESKDWLGMNYDPKVVEEAVRRFWEEHRVREKLMDNLERNNRGVLGFYEGPPTLNGRPHVGHARGRVIKDLYFRWRSMQGYYIPFYAGWDCQGLPVELEAEKRLGVRGKRQLLEEVGEERFVEECKKTLDVYYPEWAKADRLLGVFIDHDRAYWTHRDEYIEREWKYLKRAWEQGLLGEGYYVVAYCPYCQTSLSNAEVGLGYEMVEDPSVYFKLKVRGTDDEYLVAWTTMPFTLVTDMLVAVNPDAEYAKVDVGGEVWVMASVHTRDGHARGREPGRRVRQGGRRRRGLGNGLQQGRGRHGRGGRQEVQYSRNDARPGLGGPRVRVSVPRHGSEAG